MSEAGTKSSGNARGAFYRFARMIHGYLSAVAFLALLFFSATGILLNHPEWTPQSSAHQTQNVTLDADTLAVAQQSGDHQAEILAKAVAAKAHVLGVFTTGEIINTEALLRFEGVRGNSSATVDLVTGAVELEVEPANAVSLINDLHRGKNAGAAWKLLIDIVGGLTIALSLIGFVIFFSLRFRLATSLLLVVVGVGVMVAIYLVLVP